LQQQPYWQPSMPQQHHHHQPQQQQPQQPQQQPPAAQQNWAYGGYSQESFPSVPQHDPVPQQPVKEEALIEL
jgi:growth factor-regulated tyrosine kinase substrate